MAYYPEADDAGLTSHRSLALNIHDCRLCGAWASASGSNVAASSRLNYQIMFLLAFGRVTRQPVPLHQRFGPGAVEDCGGRSESEAEAGCCEYPGARPAF